MGRELRQVPANWEHPKNENGDYIPLYDEYYGDVMAEWIDNHTKWLNGTHPDQEDEDYRKYKFYAEYWGDAPSMESYRNRQWEESEATHFQIYENVTEGTPISPVLESREAVAVWLESQGYSPTAAKSFSETGYAPSMVMMGGFMASDIHSLDLTNKNK